MIGIEAQRRGFQTLKALNHQSRSNQEDQGERHFESDQAALQIDLRTLIPEVRPRSLRASLRLMLDARSGRATSPLRFR